MTDKPETQEETALIHAESDGEAASNIVSLTSKMNTKQLQQATKRMSEQRAVITQFVKDNLKEDTDFGAIESTSKTGKTFKSKPTLFKPGMEKIFSLFGLTTELVKDTETLDMLTDQIGLVAYKCNVYKNGVKIAEGRGAARVGDIGRDANSTIKIAEKRARMDACLSLGFSEFFTQDMDDPDYRRGNAPSQPLQVNNPGGANVSGDDGTPITDNQRKLMYKLLTDGGADTAEMQKEVLSLNGLDPKKITRKQASKFIDDLLQKKVKWTKDDEN